MMMDLVEIKTKKKWKKITIISIVAISIIALFVLLGILLVNITEKKQATMQKELLNHTKYQHQVKEKKMEFTNETKTRIKKIYRSDEKRVFLTFDDGPSKAVTPLILDVLKQEQIKATFFTLGSRVELYPEIVKREYSEGHYIANHGYSHVYSQIYASPQSVLDEYNHTEEAIRKAINKSDYTSHLFRFPGGSVGGKYANLKKEAVTLLDQNNIAHLDWNALTGDAEGKKTKEDMLCYVKELIGQKQSVVILMHDAGDKILTYEILPELIQYLKEQGYSFKNIYDLYEN